MRDGKPRTDSALIEQQLVMVPAQAGINGPVAVMNEVFNKGCLFEVRTSADESQGGRGIAAERVTRARNWIRNLTGGNDVAVVFVQKEIVEFEAGFPFVMAVVYRDRSIEVPLVEVVVLEYGDGPRKRIGIEVVRVAANHAAEIQQNIRRENVTV